MLFAEEKKRPTPLKRKKGFFYGSQKGEPCEALGRSTSPSEGYFSEHNSLGLF